MHKRTNNFDNKIATYEKCVNVAKIAQNILEVNLPAQKKSVTNTTIFAKLHKRTSNFDNKIATYEKCVNVAKSLRKTYLK